MMFSRLAADALLHFAALGRSKHTVASYDAAFRQFHLFLDARGLPDDTRHFTDERVMQFMDWLHAHKAGSNTVRTRLSALASLAKFGARMKHRGKPVISVNPLLGLERPKKRRPREKFLFPVEMRGFMSVPLVQRERVAREVLVDTGLRVSELCALDVGDLGEVARDEMLLSVRVKGGEIIQLPISPHVIEALRDWLLERGMPGPNEPLLLNARGRRWNRTHLAYLILSIGQRAKITRFPVTPHVIRHTVEMIRRMAGIDPTVRSKLMGHSNLGSLISYQHLLPRELGEARRAQVKSMQQYLDEAGS